jgi:hypothetical protein
MAENPGPLSRRSDMYSTTPQIATIKFDDIMPRLNLGDLPRIKKILEPLNYISTKFEKFQQFQFL